MWQDKVETCVSSPDPRFIHLTNLSHPRIQPSDRPPIHLVHLFNYLFIHSFVRSFTHPSVRPAFQLVPIPSMDRPT